MIDLILHERENANLVLDDRLPPVTFAESVSGEIFWRFDDEPDADPQFLGAAVAGKSLQVPFDFSHGRAIKLFIISRTATGEQSALKSSEGVSTVFNPNTETAVPHIYQSGASGNDEVRVAVENYTDNAQYRKIQVSGSNTFASVVEDSQDTENESGDSLNPFIILTRDSNLTNPETKYVRVAHSSNGTVYGAWSNALMITFADDGGGGGTSPGTGYGGPKYIPVEP
jgi:hypothetical protein